MIDELQPLRNEALDGSGFPAAIPASEPPWRKFTHWKAIDSPCNPGSGETMKIKKEYHHSRGRHRGAGRLPLTSAAPTGPTTRCRTLAGPDGGRHHAGSEIARRRQDPWCWSARTAAG
ncbi:MAG: hypothetical protein MZU91_01545 [Desulfosudis oleivorans]|nr:hypothetical protein [Desulfosudis oleivorans]